MDVATTSRSFAEWYALGGPVMHGIVLCSLAALGIVIERAWTIRRPATVPRKLAEALPRVWDPANPTVALAACEGGRSTLARLAQVGFGAVARGKERPLEVVASAADGELRLLRRNLPLLAALANVATMLGLFGTVLGMVQAFELIAEVGVGDAKVVASGIFQALVTTAAGLGVGIPTLLAHALLRRRVDDRVLQLEHVLDGVFGEVHPEAEPGPAALQEAAS